MAHKFTNPFAPLRLSDNDKRQLHELGEVFVANAIEDYEAFISKDASQVDPARWKLVTRREDIRVYKERAQQKRRPEHESAMPIAMLADPLTTHSPAEASASASASADDADSSDSDSDLLAMLTVGTTVGSLHDFMYGTVATSVDMARIRTSYTGDHLVNGAVLETLVEPTVDDPFRSMAVKWVVKGQPSHLRTVVKNRDMVYLEYTGLTRLPTTGEVVGFHLLHSVSFPQTPALDKTLRGNISICGIFRQHNDDLVEVFAKGFLDPTGRVLRAVVTKSAAQVMASTADMTQCAQLKKLAFAMRHRNTNHTALGHIASRRRQQQGVLQRELGRTHSDTTSKQTETSGDKCCSVCSKQVSKRASSVLSFKRKSTAAQCRLCLHVICSHCRVKKQLSSITPDRELRTQSMSFCVLCVAEVKSLSAWHVAADEILLQDGARGYGASVASTGSTTSGSSSLAASSLAASVVNSDYGFSASWVDPVSPHHTSQASYVF
ncbi:hypothetical protein PINS_up006699 [Pythium insidiosum]|nr:hypothetical protein PINS_up006699 [Pythium insidiosum]